MLNFFAKPWIPYVFPFLLTLICAEAAWFLPQWRYQLIIMGGITVATLLYLWRDRVTPDAITTTRATHTLVGIGAGFFLAATWYAFVHMGVSTAEPLQIARTWSGVRKYIILIFLTGGFALVTPVVSELFWRSFLLRYFIKPDFKSIQLGTFNLFSFIMVVVLGSLPTSNHSVYLFISGLIYTGITIWSKSVYSSIIAHITANSCIIGLALSLGITFY